MRISVIGAGSWGTAVTWLLGGKGHDVRLWSREPEIAEGINDEPPQSRLPARRRASPTAVFATPDMEDALFGAEAVVMVTPSIGVRETAEAMKPHLGRRDARSSSCPRASRAARTCS